MKKTKLLLFLLSAIFASGCSVNQYSSEIESFKDSTSMLDEKDLYSYYGTFKTIQELYSSNELSDNDLYNIYYHNEEINENSNNNFDQEKIKIKEPLKEDTTRKIIDDYYLYVTSDECKVKVDYESIRLAYYSGTYNGYIICMVLAPHDGFKIDNNFISTVNVGNYSIKTLTTTCNIYGWKSL